MQSPIAYIKDAVRLAEAYAESVRQAADAAYPLMEALYPALEEWEANEGSRIASWDTSTDGALTIHLRMGEPDSYASIIATLLKRLVKDGNLHIKSKSDDDDNEYLSFLYETPAGKKCRIYIWHGNSKVCIVQEYDTMVTRRRVICNPTQDDRINHGTAGLDQSK